MIYFVFPAFISRPTSLLASKMVSVFCLKVGDINIDLRQIGCDDMDVIHLAQDGDR
jgi:hypothetical protein